jgi:rubredoxin
MADDKWVCSVCGWVYDGEEPFADLPDDYRCPICGAPKTAFEKEEV